MTQETQGKRALVLGATGGIGGELARQLRDAGWEATALTRREDLIGERNGVAWVHGDAMDRESVKAAARPVQMSNARLVDVLGREPHTRLDVAVEATLRGIGCLA